MNATSKFLQEAGLSPNEIDQIVEIMAGYVTEGGEENNQTGDQRRGLLPHITGAADAAQRRLAYDSYGNPRPRRQPMSTRQRADLERRFPGIGIA